MFKIKQIQLYALTALSILGAASPMPWQPQGWTRTTTTTFTPTFTPTVTSAPTAVTTRPYGRRNYYASNRNYNNNNRTWGRNRLAQFGPVTTWPTYASPGHRTGTRFDKNRTTTWSTGRRVARIMKSYTTRGGDRIQKLTTVHRSRRFGSKAITQIMKNGVHVKTVATQRVGGRNWGRVIGNQGPSRRGIGRIVRRQVFRPN